MKQCEQKYKVLTLRGLRTSLNRNNNSDV